MRLDPEDNQNPMAFIRKIQHLLKLRLIEYGIMGEERQLVCSRVGRCLKANQEYFFGEFYTGIDYGYTANQEFETIAPEWLMPMLDSQENAEWMVEWLTEELENYVQYVLNHF